MRRVRDRIPMSSLPMPDQLWPLWNAPLEGNRLQSVGTLSLALALSLSLSLSLCFSLHLLLHLSLWFQQIPGKPNTPAFEYICRRWDIDPSRTIMIGDRTNTDVLFGKAHNLKTMLVLSGCHQVRASLSPSLSLSFFLSQSTETISARRRCRSHGQQKEWNGARLRGWLFGFPHSKIL